MCEETVHVFVGSMTMVKMEEGDEASPWQNRFTFHPQGHGDSLAVIGSARSRSVARGLPISLGICSFLLEPMESNQ